MNPSDDQQLEKLVHENLRALPLRSAPRSLETRVLAELARRAALPWWRQSFAHWPLLARIAFIIGSIGLAKFAIEAGVWVLAGLDLAALPSVFAAQFGWVETGLTVFRAIGEFVVVTIRSIPSLWLYGGLAVLGALYATLFGLGAVAYRTLYTRS